MSTLWDSIILYTLFPIVQSGFTLVKHIISTLWSFLFIEILIDYKTATNQTRWKVLRNIGVYCNVGSSKDADDLARRVCSSRWTHNQISITCANIMNRKTNTVDLFATIPTEHTFRVCTYNYMLWPYMVAPYADNHPVKDVYIQEFVRQQIGDIPSTFALTNYLFGFKLSFRIPRIYPDAVIKHIINHIACSHETKGEIYVPSWLPSSKPIHRIKGDTWVTTFSTGKLNNVYLSILPQYLAVERLIKSTRQFIYARTQGNRFNILLHGPPGTGKTMFVHHLSYLLDIPCVLVTPKTNPNVLSNIPFRGQPILVLFDEVDRFFNNEGETLSSFIEANAHTHRSIQHIHNPTISTNTLNAQEKDIFTLHDMLSLCDGTMLEAQKLIIVFVSNHIDRIPAKLIRPGRMHSFLRFPKHTIESCTRHLALPYIREMLGFKHVPNTTLKDIASRILSIPTLMNPFLPITVASIESLAKSEGFYISQGQTIENRIERLFCIVEKDGSVKDILECLGMTSKDIQSTHT